MCPAVGLQPLGRRLFLFFRAGPRRRHGTIWSRFSSVLLSARGQSFSSSLRAVHRGSGWRWTHRAEFLPSLIKNNKTVYYYDLPHELREQIWNHFLSALMLLLEGGKLGAVLLQFPPWFMP